MATVLDQLEAMRGVKENWDSEGAAAPAQEIVTVAIAFWRNLQRQEELPQPYVTPNRIGGVLFFWEFGPHQIEVEFLTPDKAEFLHLDRDTDEAVTGTLTLNQPQSRSAFAFNAILAAMQVTS